MWTSVVIIFHSEWMQLPHRIYAAAKHIDTCTLMLSSILAREKESTEENSCHSSMKNLGFDYNKIWHWQWRGSRNLHNTGLKENNNSVRVWHNTSDHIIGFSLSGVWWTPKDSQVKLHKTTYLYSKNQSWQINIVKRKMEVHTAWLNAKPI